ncbi:MAG: hypothetical protein IJZ80_01250 [Clostridia bacterium]|nr:hypothetical protein [Clostridia bacterium]
MKMKHLLSLILACILCISLIACNKTSKDPLDTGVATPENNGVEETTPEEETTTSEEETTAESGPQIVTKSYNFTEILDKVKVYGRMSTSTLGLELDHTAAGVEFNAYIEGSLTVTVNIAKGGSDSVNDNCYFTLYIDGVKSETRFKALNGINTTFDLANFSEGGVHNIRLVKQTEAKNALCTFRTVSFTGYFETKPVDAAHYVEFLGDSITVGYGNLIANGGSNAGMATNQDATQAFAYLAAQKLKADYSMVAVSGIGVVKGYRTNTMKTYFEANSLYRSTTVKYEPTRIPDLVVINLGTNDENNNVSLTDWQAGVSDLVTQVRAKYGKNVPIVWVYNMMSVSPYYPQYAKKALDALGGEAAGLYMCKLVHNKEGGGNHPNLAAHATASEELVTFIQSKNILK